MPYTIKKVKGKKPYRIINKETGKVVGSSSSMAKARASIGHRMSAESKNIKKYKRTTDNRMRSYGETDLEKKTVRINKSKTKNKKAGDIINTIVHEKLHIQHPKKRERSVRKDTLRIIKKMGKKLKERHYKLFGK